MSHKQIFSCHNKDKKEREYAEFKENQETCKMSFFSFAAGPTDRRKKKQLNFNGTIEAEKITFSPIVLRTDG